MTTVKDLIQSLKMFDPEAEVRIVSCDDCYRSPTLIGVEKYYKVVEKTHEEIVTIETEEWWTNR